MNTKLMTSLFIVAGVAVSGCASIKKADVSSSANPSEEIAKLEKDIAEGHEKSLDVLAVKDFNRSQKHLKEAKEELADDSDRSDVLEEIAYGRAYLERAEKAADSRRPQVEAVLTARSEALKAGIRKFDPTRARLKELDDEMRDNADDFSKLSSKEIADLQAKYMNLQFDYLKDQQIGQAKARIQDARDHRGARYAPVALRRAEVDVANAENLMNANRQNPSAYEEAVAQANLSSEMLAAILKETKEGRVDEKTATQVVMQDRRIQALQGRVGSLQGQLGETSQEIGQMNRALQERDEALQSASATLNLQKSLQEARQEFSPDEAEVFQEGDKLLIRLKAIQFASGRAELPAKSMELLAKVRGIAEELGPQEVVVEGHTDATGKADLNEKLSQQRAESVVQYLKNNGLDGDKIEAKGYGFEKPIASNKSASGRAQNRRVDILITPVAPSAERQPASVEE